MSSFVAPQHPALARVVEVSLPVVLHAVVFEGRDHRPETSAPHAKRRETCRAPP
jgi:hypothetical protein